MRYILWELNVKAHGFEDRLIAAEQGGFDALTISYRTFQEERAAGRSPAELAVRAKDLGLSIDFLDGMTSWSSTRYCEAGGSFMKEAFDFSRAAAFDLCLNAGIPNIVAVAGFAEGSVPSSQIVDDFGLFCEDAAAHGIAVQLEPMPILGSGIGSLKAGWEILSSAGAPNATLLFDSWHFMRRGADLDLLASLPRGTIGHIQLADGYLRPFGGDIAQDAFHHRLVPGEGDLPLTYLLKILAANQNLISLGPEAILDRLDALEAIEVGFEVGAATENSAIAASLPIRSHRR